MRAMIIHEVRTPLVLEEQPLPPIGFSERSDRSYPSPT